MSNRIIRPVGIFLVLALCLLNFDVPRVQAQMVGTDTVIAGQQAAHQRAQVADFLAREDVIQILNQYGVDPLEAQQRAASLSERSAIHCD